MPLVAIVDGIRLMIFFKDHDPPHFHAISAEYRLKVEIDTLRIIQGGMPIALERKVIQWAEKRREKLMTAWHVCQQGANPGRVN